MENRDANDSQLFFAYLSFTKGMSLQHGGSFCLLLSSRYHSRLPILRLGMYSMALPVMEFQDQGYKIIKIFAKSQHTHRKLVSF